VELVDFLHTECGGYILMTRSSEPRLR